MHRQFTAATQAGQRGAGGPGWRQLRRAGRGAVRRWFGGRGSGVRWRRGATGGRRWWRGRRVVLHAATAARSEEHTSELQSQSNLVCRLLLEKKKKRIVKKHVQGWLRDVRVA